MNSASILSVEHFKKLRITYNHTHLLPNPYIVFTFLSRKDGPVSANSSMGKNGEA
jgi:hypothetical protein